MLGVEGAMSQDPPDQGRHVVKGTLRYQNGLIPFILVLHVDGSTARFADIRIDIPRELQRPEDPAEAPRLAKRFAGWLLDGIPMHGRPQISPDILDAMDGDLGHKVDAARAELGRHTLSLTEQRTCDDDQCFTFAVAAKKRAQITVRVHFEVSRWQVVDFNLSEP
jgi:hypothetical protein